MKKFYVYVYSHPDTGVPFYIGKGSANRYKKHLTNARNPHLKNKINKLKRQGKNPLVDIVLRTDSEDLAYEIEEGLINHYKRSCDGGTLCNQDLGTRGSKVYNFDDKFFELLGKLNDHEISRMYGCSYSIVRHYRDSLDIPPAKRGRAINSKLNDLTDNQVDELKSMVGTQSDKSLARLFGISHSTVKAVRDESGIPAFSKANKVDDKLLGTMSDEKLAEMYSCSAAVISKKRYKLGIPPFGKGDFMRKVCVFKNKERLLKCPVESFIKYTGVSYNRVNKLVNGRTVKTREGWYYLGSTVTGALL